MKTEPYALSIDHKSSVVHVMLEMDSCLCVRCKVRCVAKAHGYLIISYVGYKEACMIVHYTRNIGHASTS